MPGSGFAIIRAGSAVLDWGDTVETFGSNTTPFQGYVDFDQLSSDFNIQVSIGRSGNVGAKTGHALVRVGGTYGVIDGTIALSQSFSIGGTSAIASCTQAVSNVWSGVQLVKLTGYGFGGESNTTVGDVTVVFLPQF